MATLASTIQANQDAGFSIVAYNGAPDGTADSSSNGGAYWKVGHGLGRNSMILNMGMCGTNII